MKTTRLTALALALSLPLAAVTACSKDDEKKDAPNPPTASLPAETPEAGHDDGHSHEAPGNQEQQDLALKTAKIMSTWSPAKDMTRTSSELRARSLMTKERAKDVVAPQRPATGEEWREAAEKKATSVPSVKLNLDDHGSQEGTTVSVVARWSWQAPNGDTFAGDGYRRYYFTFTDEAPYKIRDYTYEESTSE